MERINISANIKCEKSKVWDFYTNPEHIVKWNFASNDWCCPSAENDLKIGGKYKARMEAKDGSFGFDFEAKYTALEEGKSFTYELTDGRSVKVDFEKNDNKTNLKISFDPESENSIDMQRDGWQAILDNFKKYAESNLT